MASQGWRGERELYAEVENFGSGIHPLLPYDSLRLMWWRVLEVAGARGGR